MRLKLDRIRRLKIEIRKIEGRKTYLILLLLKIRLLGYFDYLLTKIKVSPG